LETLVVLLKLARRHATTDPAASYLDITSWQNFIATPSLLHAIEIGSALARRRFRQRLSELF
jgi:hypothetical protein